MADLNKKLVKGFVAFGKKHRKLTVPVIAALALCLTVYYSVREFWRKLCESGFRRRLVSLCLVTVLLITQVDMLGALAAIEGAAEAEAEDSEPIVITKIAELPEEVRFQTVPLGTALEEIVLPAELAVQCIVAPSAENIGGGTA